MTLIACAAVLAAVNLTECPKCEKRMRIADDGKTATVNVCRLRDDAPDRATFDRRVAAMKARAEAYLRLGERAATGDRSCPLMGWSSWNACANRISEEIILENARILATNGLKAAGYLYVNTDDGFFDGREADGTLRFRPDKFPRGMKGMVDAIHALGLRAGIYSDAGSNTCGCVWGKDKGGVGAGLYEHDAADCKLHFVDLGFDFFKVDYCGAKDQKLNEERRYREILAAIRATGRTDVRLNICRCTFPGTWAAEVGDSWRTTGDIRAVWKSVRGIISENLYLSAYARPGHYNDMDMMEVGKLRGGSVKPVFRADKGLTEDEELTHFGIWCMMSSPLLIGCDLRTFPQSSLKLVTNPYLIALDQNRGLGVQGEVVQREGEAYVLVKDADERFGTSRYVAFYNAEDCEHEFRVRFESLELGGSVAVFDLADRSDIGEYEGELTAKVPAHGSRFFRFDAARRLERTSYEAEAAYLSSYSELPEKPEDSGAAYPCQRKEASGGVAVTRIGGSAANDLVWKDVRTVRDGRRTLTFFCATPEDRELFVSVDGLEPERISVKATGGGFVPVTVERTLPAGVHAVRIFNPSAAAPDVDRMSLR